jgi:polygalacturonase
MVKARKAIESLYDGTCTITEHQKIKKENKSTAFVESVVVENQPCRISFKTVNNTTSTETGASALVQVVKLFVAPEIKVKPGSKISVTQNNVTTEYKNSGEPAYYSTHQEIILELFKGWS